MLFEFKSDLFTLTKYEYLIISVSRILKFVNCVISTNTKNKM